MLMKNKTLAIIITLFLTSVGLNAQTQFQGPIVVGMLIGGGKLTIQDIGTFEAWTIPLSDSYTPDYTWSPDGCHILFRGVTNWNIFSLTDFTMNQIPSTSEVGKLTESIAYPIWDLDSTLLVFSISSNSSYTATEFYTYDVTSEDINLAFEAHNVGPSGAIKWVSETELLYGFEGNYYTWNKITSEIENYFFSSPRSSYPANWYLPFYITTQSESQSVATRFFSVRHYEAALARPEEYEEFGPTESAEPQTGFDIYLSETNEIRHVDMLDQYLQSLTISPSGKFVVAATYYRTTPENIDGIYLYDIESDTLSRISDFITLIDSEYGVYEPSFSSDEQLLAVPTIEGYDVYDLASKTSISLSGEFAGPYMRLSWSPNMDYQVNPCD